MNKLFAAISVLAFFVIVVMMFMFSPTEVGALGIFVFFVLCYAFFLGLAVNICKLFLVLAKKVKKILSKIPQAQRKTTKKINKKNRNDRNFLFGNTGNCFTCLVI